MIIVNNDEEAVKHKIKDLLDGYKASVDVMTDFGKSVINMLLQNQPYVSETELQDWMFLVPQDGEEMSALMKTDSAFASKVRQAVQKVGEEIIRKQRQKMLEDMHRIQPPAIIDVSDKSLIKDEETPDRQIVEVDPAKLQEGKVYFRAKGDPKIYRMETDDEALTRIAKDINEEFGFGDRKDV